MKFCIALILLSISNFVYCYNPAAVQSYIAQYRETALKNEREFGIPATIILAQGILESGAGASELTKASNNHFGIKSGASWKGPVFLAKDDEVGKSRFRCYSSSADSFKDHARLLSTSARYRPLFSLNIYDYRGWAHGLKKAGYASAPHYAQALIGIIDQYRLYEINGGVKLKPGRTVIIKKRRIDEQPAFGDDCVLEEDVESEEQTMIREAERRYAVLINDIHCTVLQPGQTLSHISRQYGIALVDLLKFNEIASESRVKDGDIVFLDKKKKRYNGPQDFHIVKKGETLYGISQEFGIMLHHLARLNKINEYERLGEGSRIRLK